MPVKTLIFIPTYNERENAPRMCEEVHQLGLDADVLFVDDHSPDGTGDVLDSLKTRFPRLVIQHRPGKLGIGSAHLDAIGWAYDQKYEQLVTMDCDFSHSPSDIPAMIEAAGDCDVSIGSRWVHADSLPGWNFLRRCMTRLGHFLTKGVLGIPQDATGAFRVYRLDRIPRSLFVLIKSQGYSFFFESLYIFNRNAIAIREVPIRLPARTYGHSKMSTVAAWRSARYVFELWFANFRGPEQFLLERKAPEIDPALADSSDWDSYWKQKTNKGAALYEFIAGVYRRIVIRRNLNRTIRRNFPNGAALLHAGCGSGQVDADFQDTMRLTALDLSPSALHLYGRNNPHAVAVKHGDIFHIPFPHESFDGVYNLGVMEHFTEKEIVEILREFRRVLRRGGKIIIFWPHARATSVLALKVCHKLMHSVFGNNQQLHPPEISHLRSRHHARELMAKAEFKLVDYRFGISDFFVQAIVVAEKL